MEKMITDEIISKLIHEYHLEPHPEGGFYHETYRSSLKLIAEESFETTRVCASTAIYFLVLPRTVSKLHKIKYDEIWHFYLGGPLVVVELINGTYKETVLGPNIFDKEIVQYVVRGGTWFGCYPQTGSSFSFVGCTVAPGFEFRDFELGHKAKLIEEFPLAKDIIAKLT
jgi:uncharacterized protein